MKPKTNNYITSPETNKALVDDMKRRIEKPKTNNHIEPEERKLREFKEGKLKPCPDESRKALAFCFKCGWNERYNYFCPFWSYKNETQNKT